MEELNNQEIIMSDRELAKFLFKDKCKENSWRTVQKMAREGTIRGQQIGRGGWVFHIEAIKDFLMRPSR